MDINAANFSIVAGVFRRYHNSTIRSNKAIKAEEDSQKRLDDMKRRGIQSDGDILLAAEQIGRKRRAKARFHEAEEHANGLYKFLTRNGDI